MGADTLSTIEARLEAHLGKLANGSLGRTITMIEVVDAAALWSDPLLELPQLLGGIDFEALIKEYPISACAAASEIGYRFEGVGTVFWGKFEGLLGRPIPVGQRHLLSSAFGSLADRFALQRPSDSGFATQFSIIAWPIANALMPYELAGPVSRLLARGPVAGVASATSTRRPDLSSLRAWAQSWEGARLSDWLQPEGPAARVITALLGDNGKGALPDPTFERLKAAFAHQSEAFFALREARRRRPTTTTPLLPESGALGLRRIGEEFVFSVSWPSLPPPLVELGRKQASARAWRPKLWGQSRTASDNMFGSLPIVIRLTALPGGNGPAAADARTVFEDEAEIAEALMGRTVDWDAPLVFLRAGDEADRIELPIRLDQGHLWVVDQAGKFESLAAEGVVAGAPVRRADLSDPHDRALLAEARWLGGSVSSTNTVARAPQDALTLPRRHVTAQTPFCVINGAGLRIEKLSRRDGAAHGLTVSAPREPMTATPGVFLFERESAFDALIEERLLAKIQSPIPGARWPVEMLAMIDDEIIAYATDELSDEGTGLAQSSLILNALQAEHIRLRILQAGRATLRVRVGRHPWDTVHLRRRDGDIDWSAEEPGAGLGRPTQEVVAQAQRPFRFNLAGPGGGAILRTFRFDDGRLAAPGRIEAPDQFGFGDLGSNFSGIEGRRRLREDGGGLIDLARSRRAWATAEARSIASVAARVRVVRQFEDPLVSALCGPEWHALEGRAVTDSPSMLLFDNILPHAVGDQAGALDPTDRADFAGRFGEALARSCPDWTDEGVIDDACADQALVEAFAEMLRNAQAHGRMVEFDADDMDFGASDDQWREAAIAALEASGRSPLMDLIAPTSGARVLGRRGFAGSDLAEASVFLADWTAAWALPRSQIGLDAACEALQIWLNPGAADPDTGTFAAMSRDVFLARTVRFVSARMARAA